MKRYEWCPYKTKNGHGIKGANYEKYKKVRIRCPECKQRMIARVSACSIGCCIEYQVPPHKRPISVRKKKKNENRSSMARKGFGDRKR